LIGIELRGVFRLEQAVEAAAVHEVGTNQSGEGQGTRDGFLGGLSEAKQQEGYEGGDGDLDSHGILGGSEETGDLENLLDPAEEQLDGPAAFVEVGDLLGGGIEVIAEDAQHLATNSALSHGSQAHSVTRWIKTDARHSTTSDTAA
jgi:hypothetical protein